MPRSISRCRRAGRAGRSYGLYLGPTIELTWALILGSAAISSPRNASLRSSGWQRFIGDDMAGRTFGVLGLAMSAAHRANRQGVRHECVTWSQNLTAQRAAEVSAELVSKEQLFRRRMSFPSTSSSAIGRSGLVAPLTRDHETHSRLVNTSRGPIVVERI